MKCPCVCKKGKIPEDCMKCSDYLAWRKQQNKILEMKAKGKATQQDIENIIREGHLEHTIENRKRAHEERTARRGV